MDNHLLPIRAILHQETSWELGTLIISPKWSLCRVKYIHDDMVSLILVKNRRDAPGDVWMKIVDDHLEDM